MKNSEKIKTEVKILNLYNSIGKLLVSVRNFEDDDFTKIIRKVS